MPHLRSKVINSQRKQRYQLLKLRCLKGIRHLWIQCIHLQFFHANIHDVSNINIFHKNREISILTIKKKTTRLTLPQEATERTKQGETKNEKHTPRYEQKCQSHTCSETINSSMYDSDLTITTSPLTSSAPYSG